MYVYGELIFSKKGSQVLKNETFNFCNPGIDYENARGRIESTTDLGGGKHKVDGCVSKTANPRPRVL